MPRPAPKAPPPQPIQYSQLTPEDFSDPARVNKLNGMLTQLINAVNAGSGATGRTILPAGIDVQGETISGLGAPKSPSDAVSAAHAESNYGAPTLAPQLDLGGKNTLKGLAALYASLGKTASGQGINATIPLAKLTVGGANGSITVKNGIIVGYQNPT